MESLAILGNSCKTVPMFLLTGLATTQVFLFYFVLAGTYLSVILVHLFLANNEHQKAFLSNKFFYYLFTFCFPP